MVVGKIPFRGRGQRGKEDLAWLEGRHFGSWSITKDGGGSLMVRRALTGEACWKSVACKISSYLRTSFLSPLPRHKPLSLMG